MSEWAQVDTGEINKEVQKDIRGVTVKVSFSPYDVPRQFRGYREADSPFFIIEFKYLNDEKTITKKSSSDTPIELEVGENSQRIYKIKIHVEKLKCETVQLEVQTLATDIVREIQKFSHTVPEKLQSRYKMPENLVFNKRNEIFSEITG